MWTVGCCDHIDMFRAVSICLPGSPSIRAYYRKRALSQSILVHHSQLLRNQILPPRTSFSPQSHQIPPRNHHHSSPHHLPMPHSPWLPPSIRSAPLPVRAPNRTSHPLRPPPLLQNPLQTIPHLSRSRPRIQTPLQNAYSPQLRSLVLLRPAE